MVAKFEMMPLPILSCFHSNKNVVFLYYLLVFILVPHKYIIFSIYFFFNHM